MKHFKVITFILVVIVFVFSIVDITIESSNLATEELMNSHIFYDLLYEEDIQKVESSLLYSIMDDKNKKCFQFDFHSPFVKGEIFHSSVKCNNGNYIPGQLITRTWSKRITFHDKVIGMVNVYDYPTYRFSFKGFLVFMFMAFLSVVFRYFDRYDFKKQKKQDVDHTQIFKKNKRKFKVRNDNFVYAVHNNNYCYIITSDLKINRWRCSLRALSAYLNHETYTPKKGLLINENGLYRESSKQVELNNETFDIIKNTSKIS